jgi:hypothetical protein
MIESDSSLMRVGVRSVANRNSYSPSTIIYGAILDDSKHLKGGRTGAVLRVLPHGTVMIWDLDKKRSYPFYKAGPDQNFRETEPVEFITDKTDTFVVAINRAGGSGRRKAVRPIVHDATAIQRRVG